MKLTITLIFLLLLVSINIFSQDKNTAENIPELN